MNKEKNDTPVLVSGGGPTGLAAALELAHHGVASTVIEPRAGVDRHRPRAKTVSPRTMEHFRRWGLAEELRRRAPLPSNWSERVVFVPTLVDEPLVEFTGVFGLDAAPDLYAESGMQVPQFVVEELMREAVESHPLIDIRLGARTLRTEPGDALTVTVLTDDRERVFAPSHLLIAEGARSPSRESLGVPLVGSTWEVPFLNAVFRAPGLHEVAERAVQYWIVGQGGPAVMGPLDAEHTWWIGFAGAHAATSREAVRERIAAVLGHDADIEVLSVDPWQARMLTAAEFQRDRILLLGESAHVNPPFGGHGFNTCIGDAVNAAWKIAATHHGWGGPELLSSYGFERYRVATDTIASAAANLEANVPLRNITAEQLRASKHEEFFSLGLTLGYSYAGSPIVAPGPEATHAVDTYVPSTDPGARLPHLTLADGRSIYDMLGREFTALVPPDRLEAASRILTGQALRRGIPLTIAPLPEDFPYPDDILLVRPDQHISDRAVDARSIDLDRAAGWSTTP